MRKLGLISSLWAALLFFPLTGNALGLGEIEISSFLNQPLKAEIAVISARPGEVDDLLISLASRDAFQKAGLDRPADLSKLRFSVEKSDDGQSARILVSTKAPVVEPFLSFLVEADWAKGRLLREFTVLLDPPSFAQQAEAPAAQLAPEPQQDEPSSNLISRKAPTQQQSASKPANSQQTASQPIAMTDSGSMNSAQIAVERPVERVASMPRNSEGLSQVVVNRGDTLWRIASNLKEKQHSVSQMMLALQMMNPDAFGNDNINNLRVGAVLRIPDSDTMNKLSKQEAQAQVLDQNGLWDDYLARKSTSVSSGTPLAAASASGPKTKSSGQLKLVAPGDGKSTNASLNTDSSSADSNQLRKKLALAEEELEAARLKNNDLNSRVGILEGQLKKFEELQKLVQIQDNSLAQLQKSVTTPDPVQPAPAPVVEMMQEPAPLDNEKPTNEMIAAAGEIMSTESKLMAEPVEDNVRPAMPAMPAEPVKPVDNSDLVPAPVIVTEVSGPSMDGGFLDMLPSLDDLLNDPVMLGGIGGVLALLFGLLFLKRKKSDEKEEGITLEEPEDLTDDDPTPIHVPSVTDDVGEQGSETGETSITQTTKFNASELPESEEAEEEEDQFARTAIISAEEMPDMEEASSSAVEQDDVLNEVDVYLAYGLYDNAEDLLKESLENSPDRADYRAKLLDTYFATKNADAFVNEATLLKSLGNAANRFWDRVQVMGYELAPENDLFSGAEGKQVSLEELAYAKPDSADFDISAEDDKLSFSDTDFDLSGDSDTDSFDLSTTPVTKSADESASEVDELDVIDIDFPDLEEDEEDRFAEASESSELEGEISDLDESDLITGSDDIDLGQIETDDSEELEGFNLEDELEGEVVDLVGDVDIEDDQLSDESLSFDLSDEIEENAEQDSAVADEEEVITDEEIDITGDEVSEVEEVQLDPTQEAPSQVDEVTSASEIDTDEDEVKFSFEGEGSEALDLEEEELTNATQVITATDIEDSVVPDEFAETEVPLEDGLDFDMSDIDEEDLQTGGFTPSDDDTLSKVRPRADDITEFKPADYSGEFEDSENAEDDAAVEVDTLAGLDKTGTFAPGDFNEESTQESAAAALREIDDFDDIEDLMLPDDVDEVGTKLDLAKAFIDMGDVEGARSSLEEVLAEGTDEQKAEATELISQIN